MLEIDRRSALKLGAFTLLGGVCAFGIGSGLLGSADDASDDDVSSRPPASTEPSHGGTKGYLCDVLGLSPAPMSAAGGGAAQIRDTGIPLRVKYQYVLAACTLEDETFDHMYSDIDYQSMAFYTQVESLQTLFLTDSGEVVALVWPHGINGAKGVVCDWIFAADNDSAEVVTEFSFDPSTGVLRARPEDLPEHMGLQFQMMIRCDCTHDDIAIEPWLTIENESSLACVEDGPLSIATWDNVCEVPVLVPGQDTTLSVDDLNVFINGLEREVCFGDRADFDPSTGMLRFPLPAVGITEVRVRVKEPRGDKPLAASVAYATRCSAMGFWGWMDGKLSWRSDLMDAVTFNNTIHPDKDNQIHPYMFNGYGFNICNRDDIGGDYSAAVRNRLSSLVNFALANYATYYAANIYTTLTGHANPSDASGNLNPEYGTDYSQVLDPIRNTKAEIEAFTSTLKARVDDEVNNTGLSNIAAFPAVTHGMTLPSDVQSGPMRNSAGNIVDYYPTETNGSGEVVAVESWWDPILNHRNGHDPVLVVSACTHAQTQSKFTSLDNGIHHWNYRGAVLFRFLEVNTTASEPYVVISFFTPRRPLNDSDLIGPHKIYGQAAVTVLKFPLETEGAVKVTKSSSV